MAGQADSYARFRPDYAASGLYAALYAYAGPPQLGRALDVATGSGQAAVELAERYRTVVAQDPSQEQLAKAEQRDNVSYEVATAEATGQPDESVDLVTCAQAMHWFDIPAFYGEAARVLRPGGTLAVWGYGLNTFDGEAAASEALRVLHDDVLGPFWDAKRKLVVEHYKGLDAGPPLFCDVERHEYPMPKPMTVEQYRGYLRSWSSYQTWREAHGSTEPDPLDAFTSELMRTTTAMSLSDTLPVLFTVFAIFARKSTSS